MDKVQKNLVIIDYQYDFVALDGKLTCGQSAIDIEKNILALISEYKNENIFITYDTHNEIDWEDDTKKNEAEIFPCHCIDGSEGFELFGGLNKAIEDISVTKVYKNTFASEKLVKSIIMKNDPNEEILVQFCGVATNVCVFQNVILLYNYFVQNGIKFSILIDKNTVASFDETLEKQALDYLVNTLGVKIK
ncbi:MAG: cysteine hydrolase family protein [Lachnospirales bacterium]